MKNIILKKFALILVIGIPGLVHSAPYDDDTFENFISGQGANDALSDATTIICYMANNGSASLTNDGKYKASIYGDECVTTNSNSTNASAAAPTSASSAGSGGTSNSADNSVKKDVDPMIVNTTLEAAGATQYSQIWRINEEPFDIREANPEPKYILYGALDQTAGISETSKFGDFNFFYELGAYGNVASDFPEFFESEEITYFTTDGNELGRGRLETSGQTIKYKAYLPNGERNVVANFSTNGDISGVYTQFTGFDDSYAWGELELYAIFGFSKQASSNSYCTKMTELYEVLDWDSVDEDTGLPEMEAYTPSGALLTQLTSEGWDLEESCYSTASADSLKNVWQYGVYTQDGERFELTNQAIPLRATVTVDGRSEEVNAYASYYGVWVDEYFKSNITSTTSFKADSESSDATYTLASKDLVAEKLTKDFVALNDINGLTLNFWAGDEYWSDEFTSLGFKNTPVNNNRFKLANNKTAWVDYDLDEDNSTNYSHNYAAYGVHDGGSIYNINLTGAKIDYDNLDLIFKNDSAEPGTDFDVKFTMGSIPVGLSNNSFNMYLTLCPGTSTTLDGLPESPDRITPPSGQKCFWFKTDAKVSTNLDANEATFVNAENINIVRVGSDGLVGQYLENQGLSIMSYNNSTKQLEIKFSEIFRKLIGHETDSSAAQSVMNDFIDQSANMHVTTYFEGINFFDHEGNRFNKINSTFTITDTAVASIFVDDYKVDEDAVTTGENINVFLNRAQSSDVSFDYAISASSTASSSDYSNLSNGTVTISAGQTTQSISFKVEDDSIAEETEKLILTLSNPSNAVLGRSSANVFIADDDSNTIAYDEYEGSYNSSTSTFSFTKGLIFEPNFSSTALSSPITFTRADWLSKMKKIWNPGTDYEETEIRELGVWSNDTQQFYNIQENSFNNPSSATTANGIISEKRSFVDIADLPSTLYCIDECPLGTSIKSHYDNVIGQLGSAFTGSISAASPSPYAAVGPYIKSNITVNETFGTGDDAYTEERSYTAGEYMDGIIVDDVVIYTKSGSALKDASNNDIKLGTDLSAAFDPQQSLQGSYFLDKNNNRRQSNYGVDSGILVDATNLAKLECDKNPDGSYSQNHPEYTSSNGKISKTRYCTEKSWSKDVATTYRVTVRTNSEYNLINSSGNVVAFDPPKTLYFQVPNDSSTYGNDAGKKINLEYESFGELQGIPGEVIDISTGQSIGEYFSGNWSDNYRYVNRFTIPDGSTLTDATTGTTYKTKALFGEEWMSKKDSAKGTLSYSASSNDLLTDDDMIFQVVAAEITFTDDDDNVESFVNQAGDTVEARWTDCKDVLYGPNTPWFGDNIPDFVEGLKAKCKSIGPVPSDSDLINNGNPSVIHGEVIFDPTPSS